MNLRKGFTLIEILISSVIIFLLFSLVYMTFFSVGSITAELRQKMRSSEVFTGFLDTLYREGKCFIPGSGDDYVFAQKELSFRYTDGKQVFPSHVSYSVEQGEGGETLVRRQKNIQTGYIFTMPALDGYESIDFMFYDGESWNYEVYEEEKITAFALELHNGEERLFFPVKLPSNEKDSGKEKE